MAAGPSLDPRMLGHILSAVAVDFNTFAASVDSTNPDAVSAVQSIDEYLGIPSLSHVVHAVEAVSAEPTLQTIENTIDELPPAFSSPRLLQLVDFSNAADARSWQSGAGALESNSGSLGSKDLLQFWYKAFPATLDLLLGNPKSLLGNPKSVMSDDISDATPTISLSMSGSPAAPVLVSALPQAQLEIASQDDSSPHTVDLTADLFAIISMSNDWKGDVPVASVIPTPHAGNGVEPDLALAWQFEGVTPEPVVLIDAQSDTNPSPVVLVQSISDEQPVVEAESRRELPMNRSLGEQGTASVAASSGPIVLAASRESGPPADVAAPKSSPPTRAEESTSKVAFIASVAASTLVLNRLDRWIQRHLAERKAERSNVASRAPAVEPDPHAVARTEPPSFITLNEYLHERRIFESAMQSSRSLARKCRNLADANRELAHANTQLAALAETDPLTGLKNRRHLHESLDRVLRFATHEGMPTSLVMMDVDSFKAYNDTFGHAAGDEALKVVARLLREGSRPFDVLARYGGEEFVIILKDTRPAAARRAAERIRNLLSRHAWPNSKVTASFGIATTEPGSLEPAELLEQADAALYRAKAQGRDRVVHVEDLMPAQAPPRSPSSGQCDHDDSQSPDGFRPVRQGSSNRGMTHRNRSWYDN
jgi:diguanylate cyclase (GGDEF)-like protein